MSIFHKLPDGSLLIEGRLDRFLEKWKVADRANRLVLGDKRPAVRTFDDAGINLTTIHPEAWDRVKSIIKPLLKQGELTHPNKRRLCEFCGTDLKVTRELHDSWIFRCPSCEANEIHAKALVGGTIGAGTPEKL